jgi:hypothetical protein
MRNKIVDLENKEISDAIEWNIYCVTCLMVVDEKIVGVSDKQYFYISKTEVYIK